MRMPNSPKSTVPMDTQTGRAAIPAVTGRLHGADRSGLGDKGWAETPADQIGNPDDTDVSPGDLPNSNRRS